MPLVRQPLTKIQPSYRCPRCSKVFSKPSGIHRHLRQPRSACARLSPANANLVQIRLRSEEIWPAEELIEIDKNGQDRETAVMETHSYDSVERLGDDDDSQMEEMEDLDSDINNQTLSHEPFKYIYETAGATFGRGQTFMDVFDSDGFHEERSSNLYYPFSSRKEWGIGSWLLRSGLSLAQINEFFSLEITQDMLLSFSNAKALRGRAELLPSGPKWISKPLKTENPTKAPVVLYYRDAVECLQLLMQNPLHANVIEFKPYQLYEDMEKSIRLYSEWLSGAIAWQMQEQIPVGATLLGAILSSDKTTISVMTGNHTAYPLLISLANIKKDYRLKNSHDTFVLLALLPVAKFIHTNRRMRGMLHDRLTHACLDIILQPLKAAAYQGVMMTDPLGFQRLCYISLASYTVDTPEAQLLACVGAKDSPVTTAYYKEFGNPVRSATRTSAVTLKQLKTIKERVTSTSTLEEIFKEASVFRLNGVLQPFWRNWSMADPSVFLTPEPLHHWHKEFWDHDAKWCIAIVGPSLIDFLFSLLQPRVGYRQFKDGISSLKQVTGRDHREIQRYIIPIIACLAPRDVVLAIRSLMDVRYMGQCPTVDIRTCRRILSALDSFHRHKNSIIDAGGRLGKGGTRLNHFWITKLELYHNVVPSIIANGSVSQWTADITEHAHHTDIKVPARAGNNQNYDSQILRSLDRMDKCKRFDLATSIRDAGVSLRSWADNDEVDDIDEELKVLEDSETLASHILPVSSKIFGNERTIVNYFDAAERLIRGNHNYQTAPPRPFRVFSSGSVAFQLARDPSLKTMTVDEAALMFSLPDLRRSLQEFISHINSHGDIPCKIGGRRVTATPELSFNDIQVWTRIRIQCLSYHYPHDILPPVTLNCLPPTGKWLHGLYDNVLVNTDGHYHWPRSRIKGHSVAQLRLIFRPVPPRGSVFTPGLDGFLAYVHRFDIVNQGGGAQCPDSITGMFALRRSLRADGTKQGGVVQVKHIRKDLHLVPRFRAPVNSRLRQENCAEHYSDFWLNDYFDKETFYAFRLSYAD